MSATPTRRGRAPSPAAARPAWPPPCDEGVTAQRGLCIVSHGRTVQGSWTSIPNKGRDGFQRWVLGAHDARTGFTGDPRAAHR
ncbi:hypothetical protein [Amycolatopsis thermalba]|uniref:hypothetical protein n=1 Tax=Amycolatopsis thermalba TaxID=944492 RepID=UPI001F071A3E|nr:hypothetical protein [Amycolatopsis thermalba]